MQWYIAFSVFQMSISASLYYISFAFRRPGAQNKLNLTQLLWQPPHNGHKAIALQARDRLRRFWLWISSPFRSRTNRWNNEQTSNCKNGRISTRHTSSSQSTKQTTNPNRRRWWFLLLACTNASVSITHTAIGGHVAFVRSTGGRRDVSKRFNDYSRAWFFWQCWNFVSSWCDGTAYQ